MIYWFRGIRTMNIKKKLNSTNIGKYIQRFADILDLIKTLL